MWNDCQVCGRLFETGLNRRSKDGKKRSRTGRKQLTCSLECAEIRNARNLKRRTTCVVCGGPKESRQALTCSTKCKHDRKSEIAKTKVPNLCVYDAPHEWDYNNMLDILHRKGYVQASDTKEKWTYHTEGYPRIKWVDRLASGVVVSRKASPGKEQQGYEDGVQQKAQEASARANTIEELRACIEGGVATPQRPVG